MKVPVEKKTTLAAVIAGGKSICLLSGTLRRTKFKYERASLSGKESPGEQSKSESNIIM